MKKYILFLFLLLGAILLSGTSVQAQPATENEALTVAANWIEAIIDKKGDWAGYHTAQIESIEPFARQGRQVGYFCKVSPKGYIIVSIRKEMAPVKCWSDQSEIDPESDEGMAALLKEKMERVLNRFQEREQQRKQMGAEAASTIDENLEINYRPGWEALEGNIEDFIDPSQPIQTPEKATDDISTDGESAEDGGETRNYTEGNTLLTSHWHQFPPYNNWCPDMNCTDISNDRAVVGCVATAGAQIMRYWNWPPYGVGSPYSDTYDWPNMPDTATTTSPAAVQNAVAELSQEIGRAVSMDYGCGASSAYTYDMRGVYDNTYRYSTVYKRDRSDYSAVDWFNLMKDEFNYNRPVQYRIPGHSIVGDGWLEIGATPVRQYHMVYGWRNAGSDTWYTLDALNGGDPGEEYLLENIRPEPYLTTLEGSFSRDATFPYRYFYRDTWGANGYFAGGQRIQFLPWIVVYNSSTTSSLPVTFQGSSSSFSYLFTRGDLNRGIKMHLNASAAVKLYPGGGIMFH